MTAEELENFCYANANVICPHCGNECDPDFECDYFCTEGVYTETCCECEKTFRIETSVTVRYSTSK